MEEPVKEKPAKKMLILKACPVKGEQHELDNIKNHAELYGMEVDSACPKNETELIKKFQDVGEEAFDYLYLSSHGNDEGFSNGTDDLNVLWKNFAIMICEHNILKKNAVVMLSCCRGGLDQVAYQIFYRCPKIAYVVGPRQSLEPVEMMMGFHIFLFNVEYRGIDPVLACKKIQKSIDLRFMCFDFMETSGSLGFFNFANEQEAEDAAIERAEQRLKEAEEILAKIDSNGLPLKQV